MTVRHLRTAPEDPWSDYKMIRESHPGFQPEPPPQDLLAPLQRLIRVTSWSVRSQLARDAA